MFSASPTVDQKIKALNPQTMDEELKHLIFERSNSIKSIKVASEIVKIKRVSILSGSPARYYQNNLVSGFTVLDEPLEHYESEKATHENQLAEIETRLLKRLESTSQHDQIRSGQCTSANKK